MDFLRNILSKLRGLIDKKQFNTKSISSIIPNKEDFSGEEASVVKNKPAKKPKQSTKSFSFLKFALRPFKRLYALLKREQKEQLSFSELRIKQKKSLTYRLGPFLEFLAYLPIYVGKKYKRIVNLLASIFNSLTKLIWGSKGYVTIKLIWNRGKLGKPLLHIGTIILAGLVFLTGGVFKQSLIVLSSEEREVFVSSKSDIVPQTVQVSTGTGEGPRDTVIKYTIKSGDTLSSLGRRFGVSPDTITYANNITNTSYLKVGQKIEIPPVDGVVYEVKSGDTLQSIAKDYEIPEQAIADFNYLSKPFELSEGQELILPDAEPPATRSQAPAVATQPNVTPNLQGSGSFIWPAVPRYISQYFQSYHPAIDIAGNPSPIYAADRGTVVRSGWWTNGYGFAVRINHGNGYVTTYAHMNKLAVKVGQTVAQGDVIGTLGSTGRSTGPHVHFTIQKNGRYLNPLQFY